jgi:GT2 family glycosyltransferase
LPRCLGAVAAQANDDVETIIVDDCSTDDTRAVAARYHVHLIEMTQHGGVSAARNRGAETARGEVLLFLDADVVLAPDGIERVRATMSDPAIGAVIGSYDESPDDQSIVSRFKNLAHHHFHQHSSREASTFWGACGAIRRELFLAAGGFDEKRYKLPSIEDVELGSRLCKRGVRIVLDPALQVKHLKRWTIPSLIVTDVMRRAIPWTILWLERRRTQNDLNFSSGQRVAALVSVAMVVAMMLAFAHPALWLVVAALAALAVAINRRLFVLLWTRGGIRLALPGFFLQQLYYLYSLFGLAAGAVMFFLPPSSRHREQSLKQV